jgi:hypothetical protein
MARPFLSIFILSAALQLWGQSSSLVHLGEGDRLEYTLYSNTGEVLPIQKIPDFSYAGYRMGGVTLPNVKTVLTLNALPGDNRISIQQAIDAMSFVPPDETGIRGAVLLKSGTYECNGPLYIRTSGVVLRGEGQQSPSDGGTQIVATARYQHELINMIGEESSGDTVVHIDTITVPRRLIGDFNHDGIQDTIDGQRWLSADLTAAVASDLASGARTTLKLTSGSDEYVHYSSKEGLVKPYIEIVYRPDGQGSNSTFNVYPTDDAYIRGGEYASDNAGAESILIVKNNGYDHQLTREVYLQFSVPAINGQLISAQLNLWCSDAGDNADAEHYVSHYADLDWDEMTITYDNQPKPEMISSRILDSEVPVGSSSFSLEDAGIFAPGDSILVLRTPNQQWIDDIGMDEVGWQPDDYILEFERVITGIEGNLIHVDVPMVHSISAKYGGGAVLRRHSDGRITNCGIEDLLLTSVFVDEEDEDHAWTAVHLEETENCWVRNVTAMYFGYGCVRLDKAYKTTVENCAMLDPMAQTIGDRKYSFDITEGAFNLIQRCYTRGGRHDLVTDAKVTGPNVFLDCLSDETHDDIGPHHRYATGLLFDNIKGGDMRVQNIGDISIGHGWSGAQVMFWNLEAPNHEIKVESPVGAMNWGIGCYGEQMYGDGYWELWGTRVQPRSLYIQQLKDRLGAQAVENITIPSQDSEYFYDILSAWSGNGDLESITGLSIRDWDRGTVRVYPNPARGRIFIDLEKGMNARFIRVLDLAGRPVMTLEAGGETTLSIEPRMDPGIYILEIHTDGGVISRKIMLEQGW